VKTMIVAAVLAALGLIALPGSSGAAIVRGMSARSRLR